MPIDRRVSRTQALLHQALFSLILEKGYDAVSIKEICDKANVGRTTFYAHFVSKDDLKRSGLGHLRQTLVQHHQLASEDGERRLGFSRVMFEHARDHIDMYRALVGSQGGAIALDTIREILSDFMRRDLTTMNLEAGANRREFVVRFIIGAYMSVLTWWLDAGAQEAPEEMDLMFRRLAFEGIEAGPV